MAGKSAAELFATLSQAEQARRVGEMPDYVAEALAYDWPGWWARPNQLAPPGDWLVWLVLAGRGFGKTRTAAEWVRAKADTHPRCRIALVNDTAADTRDVMVEGKAGLLAVSPPWNMPFYEPSKRRVTWPNGSMAILYAAETPELLRGPEHDFAWCDEPAKWKNLRKTDAEGGTAWDNMMMGLRSGPNPQCVATTTPRPLKWLRDLMKDPQTKVTRGSSYDNRANLSAKWFAANIAKYEGTRLGRQEINAELLEDNPNALWTQVQIDALRERETPDLQRIVVAVDPAVTSNPDSAETGIVVAGKGWDGHGYVLADATLDGPVSPDTWAGQVVAAYRDWLGDRVVGENNNGGDLVETVIRHKAPAISYSGVRASRGKARRAEPIAALYEQGRVHHVGLFPALEDQMCQFDPSDPSPKPSPDRMDALVWALTELFGDTEGRGFFDLLAEESN